MALKKTVTLTDNLKQEVEFKDAYIRVNTVVGGKHRASAHVAFYRNDTADLDSWIITKEYPFEPSMDGPNFIAQAYTAIKALPEFAGAIDC